VIFSTEEILRELAKSPPLLQFLLIAVSSAFTEEVAVIGVLGLARSGRVSLVLALSAIFIGTMAMNVGLYLGGRFAGHKALSWKVFRKFHKSGTLDTLHKHVDNEGWWAVAISRFVPGTRLPVFVLSGILDMEWHKFVSAIVVSTVLWILAALGLFQVVAQMAKDQPVLLAVLVVSLVALIIYRLRRKKTA
jgi:membrane protein DedA with SNARE-associated domain